MRSVSLFAFDEFNNQRANCFVPDCYDYFHV